MDSTSVSLLRRLQSDESEVAWERFVDLYAPLIYHWGRGHGLGATDASDLVQDVLAILVTKLPEFDYDPKRRFRGWLRTVTLNRANDFHRKDHHRGAGCYDETIQADVSIGSDVDLLTEQEYRRFLANRALQVMRAEFHEKDWKAMLQHVIEGRKAVEVARDLGITVNMVYLAKSRILRRLREELDGLVE